MRLRFLTPWLSPFIRVHRRLACVIALSCCLVAQQPTPNTPPPANGTVKFQANAQLVVKTVTVTYKNSKTVEGLTAKDFSVTEDGEAQTVSFCEFQTMLETPEPPVTPAPAAEPVAAKVDPVVRTEIAPERPGDLRYRDRRLIVLSFDMGAMPPQDQVRAQTAAIKFIRTQMTPADRSEERRVGKECRSRW